MTDRPPGRRDGSPGRALRSAPVRQTLLLLAVFCVVGLTSLGAVYLKLRSDLAAEMRSTLQSELESFDLTATPRALAAIVGARARATAPESMVIVFLRSDGGQVGNAGAMMDGSGVQLVPLDGGPPLSPNGYIHDVRKLSGGVLILGLSLRPQKELADTFMTLLLLSLVPTALVSLIAGGFLARRSARRVSAIERTLDRLSGGDLSARVAGPTGADDLARIAGGVNRLARKQQASTEALRQVTTDIAHDLKTPLQRAAVLLDDLEGQLDAGSHAGDLAGGAAEEIDRAVKIFHAILRIAQIEGGNLAANFAPVDLCETVRGIVDLYQPALEEAGDTLDVVLPDRPVIILGDADFLGQAVSNLIENAHRHTPCGSCVTVSVTDTPAGARVEVADNGPGIPPGERENVLRRFYRLEQSRTTPGQGLGLSLVTAIAALHGGRFELSDNAPGTRASILFPDAD